MWPALWHSLGMTEPTPATSRSLPQTPERYLRAPRVVVEGEEVALYLIGWEPGPEASSPTEIAGAPLGIERVLRVAIDPDGAPGDLEAVGAASPAIAALEAEGPTPTTKSAALLEAFCAESEARVRVKYEGDQSVVTLEPRGAAPIVVFRARAMVAAPAIARAEGGWIVAFHHDLREDTHQTDVAKWIALRRVTEGGDVLEPAAPMCGRDRDLREVEQSFEFPSLVVGKDGAIALFGRGSHNFWRQDLDADGFAERVALSDGEWGSRGRWVSATRLGERVYTAQRERRAIVIGVHTAPSGGAPEWKPALVSPAVPEPASRVRIERSKDPASRHGMATYFGDIQQHSAHSDGVGSADEAYLRARHRYGDDFVALTDHESFLGKRTGPGEWEYLQDVADRHDEPGAFATLIAYEWTGKMYPGPGHKCVYLPRRGMRLISRDELPEGRDLVQAIRALGGIASPHHIGWTGCDEAGHDPVGQPVWEICSCHGCYEHADHPLGMRGEHTDQLADVMLAKGHRFGFTASSDSHGLLWHHGESRKRDPYRTGLTAVQAPELTREAVFEALVTRRCYGTSGAKILLDMSVDGHPMGSELPERRAVEVHAEAVGEGPMARLELVTRGGVVASVEAVDNAGGAVRLEARVDADWVYARAVQRDGEMAWASPVFMGPPELRATTGAA